jgi:hypothetical protein
VGEYAKWAKWMAEVEERAFRAGFAARHRLAGLDGRDPRVQGGASLAYQAWVLEQEGASPGRDTGPAGTDPEGCGG